MLNRRIEALRKDILWGIDETSLGRQDFQSIRTLECWDYKGIANVLPNKNYRELTLAHQQLDAKTSPGNIERMVNEWLAQANQFAQPKPPSNAGPLQGGLRIVICERPGWRPSMSLSEGAFKSIERAFNLHGTTIHSFLLNNGSFASYVSRKVGTSDVNVIQIVLKVPQKTEITNCLMSLTYNVETCWTDAFICGSGMTKPREKYDPVYGSQIDQLLGAILSEPRHWSNPMLVPCSLLTMCMERMQTRLKVTDYLLIDLENHLGVTYAGGAGLPIPRDNWPEDIDIKNTMRELHSVLPQTVFMQSFSAWLCRYAVFLIELEARLSKELQVAYTAPSFDRLADTLQYVQSVIEGMANGFNVLRERANSQINLLFNVISQQESLINHRGNALSLTIATSSKQDGISMSTFTFITALFLPGTYIASLFSMSMFNWEPNSGQSGANSTGYVSDKFWLYWAVTVPLTIVTLAGWYAWYEYAYSRWHRSLGTPK